MRGRKEGERGRERKGERGRERGRGRREEGGEKREGGREEHWELLLWTQDTKSVHKPKPA